MNIYWEKPFELLRIRQGLNPSIDLNIEDIERLRRLLYTELGPLDMPEPHIIDPCPHCGTTELLCGHPNHCTSDKNPANEKIWFGCKFTGRKIDSIGKFYSYNHQVQASSEEQAQELLYELFDHITNLTIERI